nr:chloride channel protein [Streptococcus anginosus]
PAGVFGVIGMGAAFAGAARAPMTAVLIIVEMTGQYSLIMPMMLAVVLATGVSRFLTRATIYTEKLRRRGDVLDDPVDATLLGAHPVSRWME